MDTTAHGLNPYYSHSGKFSASGALLAALCGLLAGAPIAWIYAWLIHWNPFIVASCLLTLCFGAAIGRLTSQFLIARKCRSVIVAGAVILLVTLVCFYVSWAVWVHAFISKLDTLALLANPLGMWAVIEKINEHGAWSFRTTTPTGAWLWAVWASEAATILGLSMYMGLDCFLEMTYCETCDQVTKERKGVLYAAAAAKPVHPDANYTIKTYMASLKAHAAELKQHIESKNLRYFHQVGAVPSDALAWYRADLNSCEKCGLLNTLRILLFKKNFEGNKVKDSSDDTEVLRQLILTPMEAQMVCEMGKQQVPHDAKLAAEYAKSTGAEEKKK
jgi:hypothetical protein